MAQTVCMTGSVRGANGAYMTFEDVDALTQSFEDLQSTLTLLDAAYKEVDAGGGLVCPAPLRRGIDVSWDYLHQHVDAVELYIRKLGEPIGRIIEQEDSWPGTNRPEEV